MSACRIERVVVNPTETLARAKQETVARGGTFEGDHNGGTYVMKTPLGPVEGTYTVTGTSVLFLVERKPMLVPCAMIAKVLDQFLV